MISAGTPIRIGSKTVKNRVTMAPTVKFLADDTGKVTEDFVKHYALRAEHDCGFICVEATCVEKEARLSPRQLGLWEDGQIEGHKRIADACHQYGVVVVPQLHHGGISTHPACGIPVGPSEVTWRNRSGEIRIKELSRSDISRIEEEFVQAAVRAQKAGYDGVQLHACHSYLINDFASGLNRRIDEYGGSAENRARFGSEIIRAIRSACGPDFIISSRVSGYDPGFEDAIIAAESYVAAGCDFLQVSSGIESLEKVEIEENLPYNKVASLGVRLHEHFKGRVPVSCVNGFRTPEQVRYMIEKELADCVDLACGLLADPAFTEAILTDKPYQKCFSCKSCCFGPEHAHACPAMKKRGADEFGLNARIAGGEFCV